MDEFDVSITRLGTGSLKWDLDPEALPFWVADMDFSSPECVIHALRDRVDHGVYGYTLAPPELTDALVDYMMRMHHARVEPEWIVHLGGCVPALATAACALCLPSDSLMTCTPVYHPIREIHRNARCSVIEVPHVRVDGAWTFDWEAMERAVQPHTKLFILCNPQNPLGTVFSSEEITRLAEFCERHDMILCSDEIHCDLVLDQQAAHYTSIRLPESLLSRTIVLTAPSKTYNIAGIGYTMAIIPDQHLRERFIRQKEHIQPPLHCFSYVSALAAYMQGEPWRLRLIEHLRSNRDALYQFVADHMPSIRMYPMQATYLAWMDCSALGLENPQRFFREQSGVFLNPGSLFGDPSCVRFNFGTTHSLMMEGLSRMARALNNRSNSTR